MRIAIIVLVLAACAPSGSAPVIADSDAVFAEPASGDQVLPARPSHVAIPGAYRVPKKGRH